MKSQKLTPWFPADVKPVRVGVYEVDGQRFPEERWFAYWDGKTFGYRCCGSTGVVHAVKNRLVQHNAPPVKNWRGLVENPEVRP